MDSSLVLTTGRVGSTDGGVPGARLAASRRRGGEGGDDGGLASKGLPKNVDLGPSDLIVASIARASSILQHIVVSILCQKRKHQTQKNIKRKIYKFH